MYQCKGCGADLRFDIKTQMLKCDNCDSTYDPYVAKQTNEAVETADAYDATTFTCPQCGGEIMSLDNTAAGFCSFCGTHTTLTSRITKLKKPKYVIPFAKTKEDCKDAYLKAAKKAIYAPKELKNRENIDSFRGIYMPFWLYNVEEKGTARFEGMTEHIEGDYEVTRYFELTAGVDNRYDGIAYDSSSSFADDISDKIVPFNESDLKPFSPAYLCGFYGDGADVEESVYRSDALKFADQATAETIKKDPRFAPYAVTTPDSTITGQLDRKCEPADAAMFPVWFMSYRNGERVAYAAVNGQTGKVVADLPADTKKFFLGSLICAIPIFLLIAFVFTLTPSALLIGTGAVSLLTMIVYASAQSSLDKRENGDGDKGANAAGLNEGKAKVKSGKLSWFALAAVIIAAAIVILDPAEDMIYYVAAVASAAAEFAALFTLIRHFNKLATRPLPQFKYKGGDNRA